MKKDLKKHFLQQCNLILGSILALLGFSSCDEEGVLPGRGGNEVCLYGTPYAKYDVHGAVLNTEGKQLEGMNVIIKEVFEGSDFSPYIGILDSLKTNQDGSYQGKGRWEDFHKSTMRVVVEDPSGEYAADSTEVNLKRTNKDKDAWCGGTDTGTANFTLKKATK